MSLFKSFDKIIENANSTIDKVAGSISKAATKIVADPSVPYGILWEKAEDVHSCRYCQKTFQMPLLKVKHHCRICAGVYCSDCSNEETTTDDSLRVCLGCKKGEVPSEHIIKMIKKELEKDESRNKRIESRQVTSQSEKNLEHIGKVLVKVGDTLGVPSDVGTHPSIPVSLSRGSAYSDKESNVRLPLSGYFEVINKSDSCIAIKVILSGGNVKMEACRPSYFVIPPSSSMNGVFDSEEVQCLLLYDNPNPSPSNSSIVFDTRSPGARSELMSQCAKVSNFKKINLFSIQCKDKNILIKVKNDGIIEPRAGDSIGRVGLFGKLQGHRHSKDILDYSTNIKTVNKIK